MRIYRQDGEFCEWITNHLVEIVQQDGVQKLVKGAAQARRTTLEFAARNPVNACLSKLQSQQNARHWALCRRIDNLQRSLFSSILSGSSKPSFAHKKRQ